MENHRTLLGGVKRMEKEALTQAFDLYAPGIYNYALRHCHNPWMADEIVGEVFARLLELVSQGLGPISNLRSYLFQIAQNLVINDVRYIKRTAPIEAAESSLRASYTMSLTVESRVMFAEILRAIENDLTEEQKHVVILRYMEGFSIKETASIMGKSVSGVKVMQHRAVAKLIEAVNDKAEDNKFSELALAA